MGGGLVVDEQDILLTRAERQLIVEALDRLPAFQEKKRKAIDRLKDRLDY